MAGAFLEGFLGGFISISLLVGAAYLMLCDGEPRFRGFWISVGVYDRHGRSDR